MESDGNVDQVTSEFVQSHVNEAHDGCVYTVPIAFRSDVKKQLSVPFRNAVFRGIIATERCCFAQLLKVVHSVSGRCFFAPLRGKLYTVQVET